MSGDLPAPVADSFTLSLRLFFFASLRPVTFSHTFPPSILHSLSRRGCWMNGSISALHVRVCVTAANVEGLSFFCFVETLLWRTNVRRCLHHFLSLPLQGGMSPSVHVCVRVHVCICAGRGILELKRVKNPPKRLNVLKLIPSVSYC